MQIGVNAQMISTRQSYRAAGSSRYVLNLLRGLRQASTVEEVTAYVADNVDLPNDLAATDRFRVAHAGWPTAGPALRVAWEQLLFPRVLRRDGITLLHGPVNALPMAWRGPCVVSILDLTFMLLPRAFPTANRAYLGWMVRFAARRADRVITISEATRRDVIRLLGAPPRRVITVYCGVDERFRPIEDRARLAEFRQRAGLPDQFILYLGTIEPRKNLVRLIDAYADLRRRGVTALPLVLAGGKGWGDAEIMRHASSRDLGDAIRFAGYVPEAEIPLWYNAASLFVYPSEYEGFGLPPLEALACGTPVVASSTSSMPEVLGDSAVLVAPTSVAAIAEGMQRVLEDEALRARLVASGLQRSSAFSWHRTATETLAVYHAAMANA